MPTLQITLPEPLQQFVLRQIAELGLESPDQYFERLLEDDRRRKRDEFYMEKVREGLAGGPPIPVTPGFWDAIADEAERECGSKIAQ
jgi:antitoxin ParD1/3/4